MSFNSRVFCGLVFCLTLVSLASGSFEYYNVDMSVLPSSVYFNNEVLVFGYLSVSDWGEIVPVESLSLKLIKGSEETVYGFSELNYVNDINDSRYLVDGFFYKKFSGLSVGTYTAVLYVDNQPKSYKIFDVLNATSNLSLNLLGVIQNTDSISSIINLNYSGASTVNSDIYFYGRKNFNSPKIVTTTSLSSNVLFNVPQDTTMFSISDFADVGQVFGLVIYGVSSDGNPSNAHVIVKNNGLKTSVHDAVLSITSRSVRKGANETVPFSLVNNGSLLTTYSFEVTSSLGSLVSAPVSVSLGPGMIYNGNINVVLPRIYDESSANLTLTVKADGFVVDEKTVVLTLLAPSPAHSVSVSTVSLSKPYYLTGETIIGNISFTNDGNYVESVTITYGCKDGAPHKTSVTLAQGKTSNVPFIIPFYDLPVSGVCELYMNFNNSYISYVSSEVIPVVAKDYSFRFYNGENALTSYGSLTEKVVFSLENIGNVNNSFRISNILYDFVELSKTSVFLGPGESTTIEAVISIPVNKDSFNVSFVACSKLSNECKEQSLNVNVFRADKPVKAESIVSVLSTEVSGDLIKGGMFSLELVNNNLVAKPYHVELLSDNVTFSVYPGVDFNVQPKETMSVFINAIPSVLGRQEVNVSISEDGFVIYEGVLVLNAGAQGNNLTGFVVAAGSVLGIGGLIVLVLFIYFYFIKKPPQIEDEFKPVEVKKADLSKPGIKNENKYW